MAKMFYSLEEAAAKLKMDVEDVRALTESGQLQEFRDQDKIMLKVEQVDLLAGDHDDDEMIPLADSGEIEPISLSESDSGPIMSADPDQTGVSIFDPEDEEDVDPSAATQVSPSLGNLADFGEAGASGSGLANLALESDDTSLGADLLEDVYTSTGSGSASAPTESAVGGSNIADTGGELFESAGTEPEAIGAAPAVAVGPMLAEAYDGAGSGLVAGLAIGMVVTLALAGSVLILMLSGNETLMSKMSMNLVYGALGVGGGVMIFGAVIGWLLLRRS
ncbi:MAG: hypothetical protein H6810_06220 [Phycisphaeraceae bacterium]|nr:MAG: hypothetical protein H6810_06220 [Phycisphaeraceae bacterium]